MKDVHKIVPVLLLVLYSLVVVHNFFPHTHSEGEEKSHVHDIAHEHHDHKHHDHEHHDHEDTDHHDHEEQTGHSLADWLGLFGKAHTEQSGDTEQYYKFYKRSFAPPVLAVKICTGLLPAIPFAVETAVRFLPFHPLQDDDILQDHSVFPASPLRAPPAIA